ncbi:MAG: ABC transporter substrate-binding protein, partial [Stackebrandtia sp.]
VLSSTAVPYHPNSPCEDITVNTPISRRQLLRGAAAATVAGSVGASAAACGSGSDPNKLTYWSMWKEGEPQAKVLAKAIDSFTKDTGIEVSVEWKGREVAKQLAPTLNTKNVPADLIDSADRFVKSTFVATKQSLDLSGVYDAKVPGESGSKISDVIPAKYRDLTVADDSVWMVPYEVISEQLWFDGNRLENIADNPPTEWDEFIDLLDKLKDDRGAGPIALDGDVADYTGYWTYHVVLRDLGPGAFAEAATDKTGRKLADPSFRDAVKKIEQLVSGGYFAKGYMSSKFPSLQQKWAAGKSDLLLMGSWAPSETAPSVGKDFEYRSFAFPEGAAKEVTSGIALIGFAVPAQAGNPEGAQKFIEHFMGAERIKGISSKAKNITPRPDIEVPAELADMKKTLDDSKTHLSMDGIKLDHEDWYTKVFQPLNTDLFSGKASADDFVSRLASDSGEFWKRNG